MPTVRVPAELTVEHLMAAVKQLSPTEWMEFRRQLDEWQAENGAQCDTDAVLIRTTQALLSVADERRLQRLASKSELGTLTPNELDEYGSLAHQAERLDVTRAEALAELVRRRGRPASVVMQEIGWKSGSE